MPRIRTIKPGFHSDEDLSKLSVETHYFASGLLNYADDEGYFNANPGLIQGQCFPLRQFTQDIGEMLNQLAGLDWIQLGKTPDGKRWGRVTKFSEHQRISHPTKSRIQLLAIQWDKEIVENSRNSPENFLNPRETLRPEGEEEREEEKEEEGRGSATAPPSPPIPTAREVVLGIYQPSPEGIPPLALAQGVCEQIDLPDAKGNKFAIEAAIRSWAGKLSKIRGHPVTHAQGCDDLIALARAAQARGEQVDKFWFEDAKYDPENGYGRDPKEAVANERQRRNRENILVGLGLAESPGSVAGPDDDSVQRTAAGGGDRVVGKSVKRLPN